MSYDIYLKYDTEDGEVYVDCDWNYTSNCAGMWTKAGAPLKEWHDRKAKECIPALKAAIIELSAKPEVYEAMNPENGWGSRATLVPALQQLLEYFQKSPNAKVSVSR